MLLSGVEQDISNRPIHPISSVIELTQGLWRHDGALVEARLEKFYHMVYSVSDFFKMKF